MMIDEIWPARIGTKFKTLNTGSIPGKVFDIVFRPEIFTCFEVSRFDIGMEIRVEKIFPSTKSGLSTLSR